MIRTSLVAAALLFAASSPALATPQLAPVWTDHVVIQRDVPIRIDGNAAAGERVSGTLGDKAAAAQADSRGRFTLEFPARSASSDPLTLTVTGADRSTTTVADILVGDVWLCSGQSNMEWPLSASVGGAASVLGSADDGLRLLLVPKDTAAAPQTAFATPAAWAAASPESAPPLHGHDAPQVRGRPARRSVRAP